MRSDLSVVAYYTPGPYEIEAQRLRLSLLELGLAFCIERIDHLPANDWSAAARWKPHQLIEWRRRLPGRDLFYVDADAIFHADPGPWLAGVAGCDIGLLHFCEREWLSGSIFLPGLPGGKGATDRLLATWAAEDLRAPEHQPQCVLARVVETGEFAVGELPPELCWIFDLSAGHYGERRPVIEHLQASRDYRYPRGPTSDLQRSRHRRLAELKAAI